MLSIKDGDKNTSFFHSITRIRSHVNLIQTPPPPSVDISSALPNNLPCISYLDAANLIREVTKEEVYLTILDLPTGKSPDPNGFNVEFYQNFWPIIGDQLFSTIRFFFDKSIMPLSWGKALVALIPKKR